MGRGHGGGQRLVDAHETGATANDRLSRRRVLTTGTKGAVAGALVWSAPVVLSSPAIAQGSQVGPPPDGCERCGVSLLVNPGAETGDLTGWPDNRGVTSVLYEDLILDELTGAPRAGGSWAFRLEAEDTIEAQYLRQSVSAPGCGGQTVRLTGLITCNHPGQASAILVIVAGTAGGSSVGNVATPLSIPAGPAPSTLQPFTIDGVLPPTADGISVAVAVTTQGELVVGVVDELTLTIGC